MLFSEETHEQGPKGRLPALFFPAETCHKNDQTAVDGWFHPPKKR